MINPIYNLPQLDFIGGESQTFLFNLLTATGNTFDANGCTVEFSIVNYANKNGIPILIKPAVIQLGQDGVPNIAEVNLLSGDTVFLFGRYIYQLSIKDTYDETEVPGQGILNITRNIHQSFVTQ